jgi:hypothetical protein
MHWLLAGLAGVGSVELFMRLPILPTLVEFRATIPSVFMVIRSVRISDHWKEKALLIYARRIFALTMLLAVYLCGTFVPFILIYGLSIAMSVPFLEFTLSSVGILFVTIVSISYARVRFGRVIKKL